MCVILLLSTGLLFGCMPQSDMNGNSHEDIVDTIGLVTSGSNSKALQIVTTFPPLYGHVANLIDDNDTIMNLVPPGTSVHFRQPKPSDVLAMEQADIIIINGLGLEEFLEDYLATLEKKGVVLVDTSVGVDLLVYEDDHNDDEDDHNDDEDDHNHEGPDPHIWLDPNNAQLQVTTITDALIALDPEQKILYTEKAATYIDELVALDASIIEDLSSTELAPFIVFHDAYQYFLQAYDLEDRQVGLVQAFHGDNPSQKDIAELIETITREGVATIYTEPQFNPSIVQRLEQETGVIAKEIDPIGTELSKDTYVLMMKQLVEAFSNK